MLNRREAELKPVPECVIIIDDIYTTGSTIEACSLVLREAGAMRIYFYVFVSDRDIETVFAAVMAG